MKLLAITTLLATISALPTEFNDVKELESRQVNGCVCNIRVGGIILQDTIPMGQGLIQRNMRVVNSQNQYCSVTFDRGEQRECDQVKQVAGPSGSVCRPGMGDLKCVDSF